MAKRDLEESNELVAELKSKLQAQLAASEQVDKPISCARCCFLHSANAL